MRVVDLIIKKKNGLSLTKEEISFLIKGYVNGEIPDYQISSLLMAICFRGLDKDEQAFLTSAMLHSGEEIDLSQINGICVDKHSTGGVGDKTTLVIGPIVASCGLKLAKMSGRGLGHTGGTLDKLESIPGYSISLSKEEFLKQVNEIGIAVVGQTANITPADKKLYALRDVTGTVESVGLIASSIMSKKLASGAHSILLDVKVGDGAFMKTKEEAEELARCMVEIGKSCHRNTVAMLTNMDQPLGEAVGNSIEVIEAIETLKGNGPKDFTELCYEISSEMLLNTNICFSKEEAYNMIDDVIKSGKALNKLKELIVYQHGNSDVVNDYSLFPTCKDKIKILASEDGYISKINTLEIGNAAMILGAGRKTKEDNIDFSVGITVKVKVGDKVNKGDVICIMCVNEKGIEEAKKILEKSFTISKDKIDKKPTVFEIIK